jgi:HSP20 family protein
MTLIKWKNGNHGNLIERRFPNVFSDFFEGWLDSDLIGNSVMSRVPTVNIVENPDDYRIEMAAPGLNKSDFKVEIDNGVLTISAEKNEESNEKETNYTRREYAYTSFRRAFSLPDSVSSDNIKATYENGILMLNVPKLEEAKQKPLREIKVS